MARDSNMFRLHWLSSKGGHIILGPFSLKINVYRKNKGEVYSISL